MLAWVRTALALFGIGLVVSRFVMPPDLGTAADPLSRAGEAVSVSLGVSFVVLGAAGTALAAWRYRRFVAAHAIAGRPLETLALSVGTAAVVSALGVLLGVSMAIAVW